MLWCDDDRQNTLHLHYFWFWGPKGSLVKQNLDSASDRSDSFEILPSVSTVHLVLVVISDGFFGVFLYFQLWLLAISRSILAISISNMMFFVFFII